MQNKCLLLSLGLIGLSWTQAFAQSDQDVPPLVPLSSMVAVSSQAPIPDVVKNLVNRYVAGTLNDNQQFPLDNKITDTVRTIGFTHNVVVKWLDPLTEDDAADAPRFGANCDFIAYYGDGWNDDWAGDVVGSSPLTSGSSQGGWIWSNHEYISNSYPTTTSAPQGQCLTFAKWLANKGVLTNDVTSDTWSQADVDTFILWHRKMLGGSWFRVKQNPRNLKWYVERNADAKRYDSTDATLVKVTGYSLHRTTTDDNGNPLPEGVVVGITGDCSGGVAPWGTIFTAEENVQSYYGDFETAWTSSNRFKPGEGFDPGGPIAFTVEPGNSDGQAFGRTSNPNQRYDRDNYGFLTEIDPGVAAATYYNSVAAGGDGMGHRKLGAMGRARWENATFATGANFRLQDGKHIVLYGGDDRRGGRVFKFVSSQPYRAGMTRAEVRSLLDNGNVYAAHFANLDITTGYSLYNPNTPGGIIPDETNRGSGRWIHMSLNNQTDIAPNAAAMGEPNKTVGEALADVNWNGIGGFASEDDVLSALFTACNKLGISEMNRPEDLEYNPKDPSGTPRIYIAFTNHTRASANNQQGLMDGATPNRGDSDGSIFALEETNAGDPGQSSSFTYWMAWQGFTPDSREDSATFAAGDPDNLAIGPNGEVFFGTDGNAGSTGDTRADAIYYLDLDPLHKAGVPGVVNPSYGKAFRIVSAPGDAEATGPWFTPDARTLFFNVQHPGEDFISTPSTWPQDRDQNATPEPIIVPFKQQ